MNYDIKDCVRCKYCGFMPLWWGKNYKGNPMLFTEKGKGHLCKPYKETKSASI